jgi:hypothetical protein
VDRAAAADRLRLLVGAAPFGFGVDDPAARSRRLQTLGLRSTSLAAPLVPSGRALVQRRVPAVHRNLWVPDIRFASCDLHVLMDQPTEAISPHDPCRRRQDNWHAGSEWRRLPQGAVRSVQVVMVDVLGQHRPQLPAAQDQHPIQHLTPNRAHPPLRIGIRPRRPDRRHEHLDRLGGEDGVERGP